MCEFAKARPRGPKSQRGRQRLRRQSDRAVDSRGRALAVQVERMLREYGRHIFDGMVQQRLRGGRAKFEKSLTRKQLERELYDLLVRYGLAQVRDAKRRGGGSEDIPADLLARIAREKENRVKLLIRETEQKTRQSLNQIIADAVREKPRPTQSEVARRIARQWFGPSIRENVGRGTSAERQATADWERQYRLSGPRPATPPKWKKVSSTEYRTDDGRAWAVKEGNEWKLKTSTGATYNLGRRASFDHAEAILSQTLRGEQEYLFSFDRAKTIARTELAQVENAGILQGIADAGFRWVHWSAVPNDGRSGPRQHWRMNDHKPILLVDAVGDDRSKWFVLPRGARAPHPMWGGLPVGEVVNCRCFPTGS